MQSTESIRKEFMKKIVICLICIMFVSGCSKKEEKIETANYYDAYKEIASEDIASYISNAEIIGDISDPKYVDDLSGDIAIITITSIDGESNYGEQTKEYCYPYTYGNFIVEKAYKGNLEVDKEYKYIRAGGIIDFSSYYNSLEESEKEKHDYLAKGINPKYVQMKFNGDIDIKVGKTYLAYLTSPEYGIGTFAKENSYTIDSFQGGLREIDTSSITNNDHSNMMVLNNFTNSWEKLEDIIK